MSWTTGVCWIRSVRKAVYASDTDVSVQVFKDIREPPGKNYKYYYCRFTDRVSAGGAAAKDILP